MFQVLGFHLLKEINVNKICEIVKDLFFFLFLPLRFFITIGYSEISLLLLA